MSYTFKLGYNTFPNLAGQAIEIRDSGGTVYGSSVIVAGGIGEVDVTVPDDLIATLFTVQVSTGDKLGYDSFDYRTVSSLSLSPVVTAIADIPEAVASLDIGTASTPVYAANSFGFAGSRLILDEAGSPPVVVFPSPGNPALCVVSGYVINGSGAPVAGATLKATLPIAGLVGSSGNILKNREFTFNTDSTGRWLFELLRSDEMSPQSAWHFACCDCGLDVDVTLNSGSYDLGTLVS